MTQSIKAFREAPAMKRTPPIMVRELAKAAMDIRADGKRQMHEARSVLRRSIFSLDGMVLQARAAPCLRERVMGSAFAGQVTCSDRVCQVQLKGRCEQVGICSGADAGY